MTELFDQKKDCCGCELCSQVCPVSIIKMRQDGEGFFYPMLTDSYKCIGCKRCINICPEKHRIIPHREIIAAYTGYAQKDTDVKFSASGGMCTVISRMVIEHNGIVYGVKYSESCRNISYGRATSLEELEAFRTSKYAQARKDAIYKQILCDLKENKMVLFIGLPCDVAAIYNYTGNRYDNFYTVELVCHGVTSPKVHEQFVLKDISGNNSSLTEFSVRYKRNGWKPYYVYEKFDNGNVVLRPFAHTSYNTAFTYLKRPSCNHCRFKVHDKEYGFQADMTVGDNHGVLPSSLSYNKWGSSVAFIHSKKGHELIDRIRTSFVVYNETENTNELIRQNLAVYMAVPEHKFRKKFSAKFQSEGLEAANKMLCIRIARVKVASINKIKAPLLYIYVKFGLRKYKSSCIRILGIFIPKYRKTRTQKP